MAKWFKQEDESWKREDGVRVSAVFTYSAKPWTATRNRPKGAPHHREDKDYQWFRKLSPFGSWGVVRCFLTAAACMKAVDKDWPLSTKTAKAA